MTWAWHAVASVIETRSGFKILIRKLEKKRSYGRSRHRRKDDIELDVKEKG
jgi:hypothetical protein